MRHHEAADPMTTPTPPLNLAALAGRVLADGRYRLVRELGSGAMGAVYEAVHEALGRRVAIKLLHPDMMQRPLYAERFRREAQAASLLRHRNSVQLLDFGNDGPLFYLVMEALEGRTLADVLDVERAVTPGRAIHIMAQVCAALGAAHDQSIIHRDVKPSNIMLVPWIDDDGRATELVKVLDFGIAKIQDHGDDAGSARGLTMDGEVCGTPEYMSPEQAEGRPLSHRSDVYACGVLLFEMLTGDVPYYGETPLATMVQHITARPASPRALAPEVSEALEAVVLRCLEKDPARRFQTARSLRSALLQLPEAARSPGLISEPDLAPVTATQRGEAFAPTLAGASAAPAGAAPPATSSAASAPSPTVSTAASSAPAVAGSEGASPPTGVGLSSASSAPASSATWMGAAAARPVATDARRRRGRAPLVAAAALLTIGGAVAAWALTRGDAPSTGSVSAVADDGPESVGAAGGGELTTSDGDGIAVDEPAAVAVVPEPAVAGDEVAAAAPGPVVAAAAAEPPAGEQPQGRDDEVVGDVGGDEGHGDRASDGAPAVAAIVAEPGEAAAAAATAASEGEAVVRPTAAPAGDAVADADPEPPESVVAIVERRPVVAKPPPARSAPARSTSARPSPAEPPTPSRQAKSAPPAPEPAPREAAVTEAAAGSKPPGAAAGEAPPESPAPEAPTAPPAAPEPVAPPSAPPEPEPVRFALDADVAWGDVDVSGSLPRATVVRGLRRFEGDVADCYRAGARTAGRDLAGRVAVELVIDIDGRARDVTVGAFGLPGVSACVATSLRRVRTDDRPDTGTVRVAFALRFAPKDPH